MKLTVRGFTNKTLKKYDDVKENPLCAISPKNQKALGVSGKKVEVNNSSVRLVKGSSEKFIGLTKTLRDSLGVENEQVVEVSFVDSVLKIV
jgi:hypothetical protein